MFCKILFFISLPLFSSAMNIHRVDDNTVQVDSEDGSTSIQIQTYSASSSGSLDESGRQPVQININECSDSNPRVRKYVAWVSVGGAITVSLITAIVNIITHFTS